MEDPQDIRLLNQKVELEFARIATCHNSTATRLDEKIEIFRDEVDKKLEHLNGVREALRDQAALMIRKEDAESRIKAATERLEAQITNLTSRTEAELKPIHQQMGLLGKPNWTILGTVASVGLATITGCWVLIGLKIDAALGPVSLSVEQIKVSNGSRDRQISDNGLLATRIAQETLTLTQQSAAQQANQNQLSERLHTVETTSTTSSQADATSRTDREQLNNRMRMMENNIASESSERKSFEAALKSDQKESEAQFKGLSVLINLTKDHFSQLFGIIWAKVFPGQTLPATPYRPQLWRDIP